MASWIARSVFYHQVGLRSLYSARESLYYGPHLLFACMHCHVNECVVGAGKMVVRAQALEARTTSLLVRSDFLQGSWPLITTKNIDQSRNRATRYR